MNLEYRSLLPANFSPESRAWIYQATRLFSLQEALTIEAILENFAANWQSHGTPVKGAGFLFFGQFIVLLADETATGVSGCSTDSSVRVIKDIEQQFNVPLFERTNLAFIIKDKVQVLPMTQLNYAVSNGFITADTLYFNNTVSNKKELENNWIIPVKQSWLSNRLNLTNPSISATEA